MPKNKGKGGKNEADDEKRELVFKEDGLEYAQVLRMLGNGRCEALCIGGTKRLCHIRGKMHKNVWIGASDIVLVGLRDYQDDKADIILKYMPNEARLLKAYGKLPKTITLNEGIAAGMDEEDDGGADDYIEFEDETSTISEGSSRAPLECGFNDCSAFSRSNSYHWCHADDEEALRWAALERLPTFECVLREIICCSDEGVAESSCHDSRRWKVWRSLTSYSRMHLTPPLDLEAIRCYKYQR